MKLLFALCFAGLSLSIRAAQGEVASSRVASQGETVIFATGEGATVQVKIKTQEVQIGEPSDPKPHLRESSCTYSRYPCSLILHLAIRVNGKDLFVPRSTFADLADVNEIGLRAKQIGGSVLTIYGGDASESYIARIEFDSTGVNRRVFSSGLTPEKALQDTTYHSVVVGD